jgi:hypothetical protein
MRRSTALILLLVLFAQPLAARECGASVVSHTEHRAEGGAAAAAHRHHAVEGAIPAAAHPHPGASGGAGLGDESDGCDRLKASPACAGAPAPSDCKAHASCALSLNSVTAVTETTPIEITPRPTLDPSKIPSVWLSLDTPPPRLPA